MKPTTAFAPGVLRVRRPALWAFGALATGVSLALAQDESSSLHLIVIAIVCAVGAMLACATRGRMAWALLILSCVALGYLAGAVRTHAPPADSVAHAMGEGRSILRVEGLLLEDARVEPQQRGEFSRFVRDAPATRAAMRVVRVESDGERRPASGTLWVRIDGVMRGLRAGDRVRVTGHALPVEPPQNPGERDFRPLANQRNLAGRLLVPSPELVERVEGGDGSHRALRAWLRARGAMRRGASSWADRLDVDPRSRAMLEAALLGSREGAYAQVQERFARVGLAHLLAISGLHLALFAWFALAALRAMRVTRRAEAPLVAVALLAYLVIVPANAPIVRAAIMALMFLAAESAGRRYDRLNLLAWTACAILLFRPLDLLSPGFQLSFLAVAALIVLAGPVRDAMLRAARLYTDDPDERDAAHHLGGLVASALAAGLTAWAITTPLVMFHIGTLSPLGGPLSALAAPAFAGVLGLGYLTMALGAAFPSAAVLLAPALGAAARVFLGATRWAESIPLAAVVTPPVPAWWAALATVCAWRVVRRGRADARACVALALLAGYVVLLAARPPSPPPGVALRVDTLAVGDGSCVLLRDASGGTMLWDCGSSWVGVGERDIPQALRALGVWRLDAIVVSHPNLDHYSGMLDAARRVRPRRVLVGESFLEEASRDRAGPVAHLLSRLETMGIPVETIASGDAVAIGGLHAEILWPPRGFAAERPNDDSIVARIRVPTRAGERVAMLFGDLEPAGMKALAAREPGLRADVIEAPHHGSARPEAIAFVGSLAPSVIVQSTGPSRLGDERWDGVKAGRAWWITARDGAVRAEITEEGALLSGPSRPAR